jgi:hypothetical protein
MSKSKSLLRQEISLRKELERIQSGRKISSEWDRFEASQNRMMLARAQKFFAATGTDLDITVDGVGIYGHTISLGRLASVSEPLGRAFRWTGNDIAFVEGGVDTRQNAKQLAEPVLAGTFGGSFGLRLSRAPIEEQGVLNQEPLFDRTAQRFIQIFLAAHDAEPATAIAEAVLGLRTTAVNALRDFAAQLGELGSPSIFQWREETVLTISASDARFISTTIGAVEPREETRTIRARLEGGDIDTGRFHLIDEVLDRHYRGKSDPTAATRLNGLVLGTMVDAVLTVIVTDSPALDNPRESFVLREITPMNIGDLLT